VYQSLRGLNWSHPSEYNTSFPDLFY
jgi:hypothetical protein